MSLIDTISVPFAKAFFGMTGRVRIYEQLQALLEGDLKLDRALDAIWDRASKQGRSPTSVDAIVVNAWRQEYRKAASLAEAVKGWVPVRDQMLIEAGELSGDLVGTLAELQEVNQSVSRMKGELTGALVYPLVLFAAIIGIIYIFGSAVIPEFAAILPVEEWTGIAATMAGLATFTQTMLVPSLLGVVTVITLLSLSMSRWRGFLRTRFDKLPPWSLYRLFQGVAFMLSLSALLRAGVHLPVALARLRDNANPWLHGRDRLALLRAVRPLPDDPGRGLLLRSSALAPRIARRRPHSRTSDETPCRCVFARHRKNSRPTAKANSAKKSVARPCGIYSSPFE